MLAPVLASFTHFSKTQLLAAGLLILAAGNTVAILTSHFAVAVAARCMAGIGAGLFTPNASAAATAIAAPAKPHHALATVMLGLSCATALGSPVAVFFAAFTGWRSIFAFVALLAVALASSVLFILPKIYQTQAPSFRTRIRAVASPNVVATLASTMLVLMGLYVTYTYCSVVFAEATNRQANQLALLLSAWGVAAIVGTLIGRRADVIGDRIIVNCALGALLLDFVLLMVAGTIFTVALLGVVVWGICGWTFVIPQQHRLLTAAPAMTTLLIALHLTAVYLATSFGALIGGIGLKYVPPLFLAGISAGFVLCGWAISEASILLRRRNPALISAGAAGTTSNRY